VAYAANVYANEAEGKQETDANPWRTSLFDSLGEMVQDEVQIKTNQNN
jgi:hypothetical protein